MNEDALAGRADDSLGQNNQENYDMKFIIPSILAALLAGGSALSFGQGPDQSGPGGQRGGPGGPGGAGGGHRPPPNPLFEALDLNHDGVISADEIAKASDSLKKLDKNGDGQLTHDETRPPRPEGQSGGGQGPQDGGQRPDDRPPGSPKGRP